MKIAIIQPRTSYHIAGSEKVSIKHAEFLSSMGNSIDFYTSIPVGVKESHLFTEFVNKGLSKVNIFRFDILELVPDLYNKSRDWGHGRWLTESIAFDKKISSELIKNKPEIILSYYLPDSLFKPIDIPNVIYLSGYPLQPVSSYKSFIQSCDATISISSIVSEKWADEIKEIKLNYILGTGVDFPLVVKNQIKSKAKYNLIFAGRLIERKGIFTLLAAFKEIVHKNDEVHLWILGDGELRDILSTEIHAIGLEDKITLTGLVDNPYDYFTMADICIFPSHESDGLMGTVLESMSAGKPVITTTNNGNEDIIKNGENGFLIEPRSSNAIVLLVEDLLKDENKRKMIGKNAQVFISKNSTWEKHTQKLMDIFKDIIDKAK